MNENNINIEELKNIIYKDNDIFIKTMENLYQQLRKKEQNFPSFKEWVDHWVMLYENFLNDNFSIKEKLILFLKTSLIKDINISNDIKIYVFPSIIRNYISKYSNEILEILSNNDIQIMYSSWFKIYEANFDQNKDIYNEIFKLPKFKEIVLNDYNFIIDFYKYNFKNRLKFIPFDYGYIIGAINSTSLNKIELFKLYNNYFKEKLSKFEIRNLVNIHMQIDSDNKSLNYDLKSKKKDYIMCLKDIYQNQKCFNLLKKISKDFNIDLKYTFLFYSKYKNTDIFTDLFISQVNKDISKKIKYLACSRKILNISKIKSLNDITLSNLISMEKNENSKINISGGPISNTKQNISFFENSNEREIRRINIDGTYKIKSISNYVSHFDGVISIYCDQNIDKKFNTTTDIAIDLVKKTNSITIIIEKEACFIIMPTELTKYQKIILIDWLTSSNKNGQLIILTYNKETNKKDVVTNETMNISDIIEFISSLEINNSKQV